MPIKNILLPEYNFVYTCYLGSIDDIQVRAYADQLKNQISGFKSYCEIIDFSRNVDFSQLSSETLTKAGALEKERSNAGTGPLAILVVDPLTYGLARTYSAFASDSRTEVLISYSFEDCLASMGFNEIHKLHIKNTINSSLSGTSEFSPATQLGFNFPSDK